MHGRVHGSQQEPVTVGGTVTEHFPLSGVENSYVLLTVYDHKSH